LIDVNDQATTLSDGAEGSLPAATSISRRRNRQRLETLRALALGAGFPILLILIWDRTVAITGTRLIPSPYQVAVMMYDFTFGGVYDDAFSGTILIHVWKSVQRVYGGFFLAALIVGVDLLLARYISAFEAASMLGCSGTGMFRQIVLPASLPAIFSGLRIAHGFAWILIVVGEMTGVPTGLGSVVMDGRTLSRTDLVITGMIVIGACGFITDRIIVAISNRLLSWSPQHHE